MAGSESQFMLSWAGVGMGVLSVVMTSLASFLSQLRVSRRFTGQAIRI
jgi:hypothetical protein